MSMRLTGGALVGAPRPYVYTLPSLTISKHSPIWSLSRSAPCTPLSPLGSNKSKGLNSRLADGRVGYRLRKPRKNGATHLVLTPVELIAKIASVVPPPKRPLLRLSGVLGPGSSWRASVVPHPGLRCAHGTPAVA